MKDIDVVGICQEDIIVPISEKAIHEPSETVPEDSL